MNDQVQEEYTITIDRLSAIPPQEILFIDIRDEDSWQHGTIPGAVHIPSGQILASSPIVTSPATNAPGAMNADGAIRGERPRNIAICSSKVMGVMISAGARACTPR